MDSYDIFNHLDQINKKYKLDEKTIRSTKEFYGFEILPIVGNQYLSHIITSVRKWFREIVENDRLEIEIIGEDFVTIEADKDSKKEPELSEELEKTVISFRTVQSGRPINPLKEYRSIAYIDISYSSLLEKTEIFKCKTPEEDIKRDLRLRLSHELSHIIIYGLLIDYIRKVRLRKRDKNEEIEKIIDEISKEFEKNSGKTNLRSASERLESFTSIMAIIIMAEKCRFHSQEYKKYIYDLDTIIKNMP